MTILTFLVCWMAVSVVFGLFLGALMNTKPDSLVPSEPRRLIRAYALRKHGAVETIYFTVGAETGTEMGGKASRAIYRSDGAWPNAFSHLLPRPDVAGVDRHAAVADPRARRLRHASRTLDESGRMMKSGGTR